MHKRKRAWVPRGPVVKRPRPAAVEEKQRRQKWLKELRKALVWDEDRQTLWKQNFRRKLNKLGHQAWVNHVSEVLPEAFHEIYDVLHRIRPERDRYADRAAFMEHRGDEVLNKYLWRHMRKQQDFERHYLFIMRAFASGQPYRFKALCPFCNLEDDEKTVTFEARLHHWPHKRRPIFWFHPVSTSPACSHTLLKPYVQFGCSRDPKQGLQLQAIHDFTDPACRSTHAGFNWVQPWPSLAFLREICQRRFYNRDEFPNNSLRTMRHNVRLCEKLEEVQRDPTSLLHEPFSERGLIELIQQYVRGKEYYGKGLQPKTKRRNQGIPREHWPIP